MYGHFTSDTGQVYTLECAISWGLGRKLLAVKGTCLCARCISICSKVKQHRCAAAAGSYLTSHHL